MRIAIVGANPATRLAAPLFDTEWSVWTCSPKNMHAIPRWDAWFEVHDEERLQARDEFPEAYLAWVRVLPAVYVRAKSYFPNALDYPEAEMLRRFGPFFFTSSIAYMLALAIAKQPEEIGIWGVQPSVYKEYEYQIPGIQYFVQKAWDQGTKVTVPEGCTLLTPEKRNW